MTCNKLYLANIVFHTVYGNVGFVYYVHKLYIINNNYNLVDKCFILGKSGVVGTLCGCLFGIMSPIIYPSIFLIGLKKNNK